MKRFVKDGTMVRDLQGKIPTILTYNEQQQKDFLDGLNALHKENEQLKTELKAIHKERDKEFAIGNGW